MNEQAYLVWDLTAAAPMSAHGTQDEADRAAKAMAEMYLGRPFFVVSARAFSAVLSDRDRNGWSL